MKVEFTEDQRQMVILALARLSHERPGFDFACNEIACKMDNVIDGRAEMFDSFKHLNILMDESYAKEVIES